jgi:phenylpyruvate tautomerase PptA (4-oxalocrotonate tautomerase family)
MKGNKRPCVILVADNNMAATFRGYFARDQWHRSLGCAPFDFNPDLGKDLLVDEGGNDPGVYNRSHELLRPYLKSHQHALVALDCEWEGSPGQKTIIEHITDQLVASGWKKDAVKVIAIEPELENWLWQNNPLVAEALRYRSQPDLRSLLEQQGFWPADVAKPPRPKETAEWVLRQTRRPRSSAIYEELAGRISVKGCTDTAFLELNDTLRAWFPAEGAE